MCRVAFVLIVLYAVAAAGAAGSDIRSYHPVDLAEPNSTLFATGLSAAKSDTVYLMGGPDRLDGMFQSDTNPSLPDWEGWTSVDLTARTNAIWHVDTFNAPVGGNAVWCGQVYSSCGGADPAEGYGNGYIEYLDWTGTVAENALATNVTVTFDANYDNEPGYDYLRLQYLCLDGVTTVATYNGSTQSAGVWNPLIGETIAFTVAPIDLQGVGNNEVHLRFEGTSDGGWSDSDCLWPTSGLAQLDNITVSGDNGLPTTTDDFESGMTGADWQVAYPTAVGDFADIWPYLATLDPCVEQSSPQVAFIDNAIIVPCTGGTLGSTWTYGPGSFTHNLTGGCAGPGEHLWNEVWSPPLAWADEAGNPLHTSHAGALFEFDVYAHLPAENGLFYVWHLSSSTDGGSTWSVWDDRHQYYFGLGNYSRISNRVDYLVEQGATHVRLALGINEFGWIWGLNGTDGTSAPYFDNVSFRIFQIQGPAISTRELELAQDNFPVSGIIDYGNLGNNSIRFDMALDILSTIGAAVVPGDSITFNISAERDGSELNGRPTLHYALKANPLFDPYRTHPTMGFVNGDMVRLSNGIVIPDRYAFDLPDTGFFFPGDVIHYYIHAEDNLAGDVQVTTLPQDLSGFGIFSGDPNYVPLLWPSSFIVHGLPTLFSATPGDQADILFVNDFGNRGGENEWIHSMRELGFDEGIDYDIYYVNAPSSGVSNGLGSRATGIQISGYSTMLYTCGNLSYYCLNQNDQNFDKSGDLDLLDTWLGGGGKNLLATGDNLVFDLMSNQGAAGTNFVSTWLSVNFSQYDISSLIGGLTTPMIIATGAHPYYNTDVIAYGGCPSLKTFDAVEAVGTATAIAEWVSPGAHPYAAGVMNTHAGSNVIYFPVDFMNWYTPPGFIPDIVNGMSAARSDALGEILMGFGYIPSIVAVDTPEISTVRNYPNPFNPATTIYYFLPREDEVSLNIYNLRGELVRVLISDDMPAGAHQAVWHGDDDRGTAVASGVYFYEFLSGNDRKLGKMALVR